jgi:hypothetical protein
MEVSQPQTPADVIVPVDYSGHKHALSSIKEIEEFHLYRHARSVAIKPRIRAVVPE